MFFFFFFNQGKDLKKGGRGERKRNKKRGENIEGRKVASLERQFFFGKLVWKNKKRVELESTPSAHLPCPPFASSAPRSATTRFPLTSSSRLGSEEPSKTFFRCFVPVPSFDMLNFFIPQHPSTFIFVQKG